jgi:tyrosinase
MLTILCTLLALVGFRAIAYAITGVSAGVNNVTGERPFRQEINVFAASGAAWDLYILSLRQLQQANQSDPLSYFQIAGNSPTAHNPLCHSRGSQANAIDVP